MSHGSHDTHHDPHHEPHEQPKPEPILRERTPETLDAAVEALEAADEFLSSTTIDFQRLFGELRLQRCSSRELQSFLHDFEVIIRTLEPLIEQTQKNFDEVPEEMRGFFDAIDFVKEARKKESLERVRVTVTERKQKIQKETRERSQEKFEEVNERFAFVKNFEKSGLSIEMLLAAVSEADAHEVEFVTRNVIANYETEPLSPATKQRIEKEKNQQGELWEEIQQHESTVQILIDQVEAERPTFGERFQTNPQNQSEEFKKLRQSFQLMIDLLSDSQRVAELTRTNKLSEAEAVRDEASRKLGETYRKELEEFRKKEKQRIDQEVARLKEQKFKKRRQEEQNILHDVQKDVPEQILKEVMKTPIDLKEVSVALAEKILEEKHGIEHIDMDLVFSLPESVLDAVVDTLSYVDIAKFMATSKHQKENLPPIYWSKSFEKKLKSLHDRFDELKHDGLFVASEDISHLSKEQKKIIEEKKERFVSLHKAYRKCTVSGDHKGEKTVSGQYNDFFVPELERLFEMKRIRQALCGQVEESPETSFVVDGDRSVSQKDGHLFVDKEPYPDSHHNTDSAPLNFHRVYGYTSAERLNTQELPNVDFKKAVDWISKLYTDQVIGDSVHLDNPVSYRANEATSLRAEAFRLESKIDGVSQDLQREVNTLKNEFEANIDSYEKTKILYKRSQLKGSNGEDLRDTVVAKTKEIHEKFQAAYQKGEDDFVDDPKKSVAERQLLVAKHNQFGRTIERLQNHSYRPVERVVAMTQEDYVEGFKIFQERSGDLVKEEFNFTEKKQSLEQELKEKKQKLSVLEAVIHDNIVADHQWRFWERKTTGKSVEEVEIRQTDPHTHETTVLKGYKPIETLMKKKEFELLKKERDALKERVVPKKGEKKSAIEIEMEKLVVDHQKRKQEIQNDIDKILRVFPLIPVLGDGSNP